MFNKGGGGGMQGTKPLPIISKHNTVCEWKGSQSKQITHQHALQRSYFAALLPHKVQHFVTEFLTTSSRACCHLCGKIKSWKVEEGICISAVIKLWDEWNILWLYWHISAFLWKEYVTFHVGCKSGRSKIKGVYSCREECSKVRAPEVNLPIQYPIMVPFPDNLRNILSGDLGLFHSFRRLLLPNAALKSWIGEWISEFI